MTNPLHFVKLGGSLITDKNRPLKPQPLVLQRLASEIAAAVREQPEQRFVLSHGSGSYGHVVGRRYQTREGVFDEVGWQGFAETGHIAAQLNRLVTAALLRAGLSAFSFPPSALVTCRDGRIISAHIQPITAALGHGLIPVVYGDVAFDETLGGTIVSTEQVLAALVPDFKPGHLTLVGIVNGVFDQDPLLKPDARPIPHLTLGQIPGLTATLGGSHGIDVTGGMANKIEGDGRFDRIPFLHADPLALRRDSGASETASTHSRHRSRHHADRLIGACKRRAGQPLPPGYFTLIRECWV